MGLLSIIRPFYSVDIMTVKKEVKLHIKPSATRMGESILLMCDDTEVMPLRLAQLIRGGANNSKAVP